MYLNSLKKVLLFIALSAITEIILNKLNIIFKFYHIIKINKIKLLLTFINIQNLNFFFAKSYFLTLTIRPTSPRTSKTSRR